MDFTGLTCNFESNFCEWISDGWIRANKSEFKSTGPQQEGEGNVSFIYFTSMKNTML